MRISAKTSPAEHRLVGIGKCSKGIKYMFSPGQPVVIGRASTCTIVLDKVPDARGDFDYVSRHHAVIEPKDDQNWSIRDNGSMNGTALLRGGLRPALKLPTGVYETLRDGDVIELADCDDFNLVFQAVSIDQEVRNPGIEGKTDRLMAAELATLQLIYKGAARDIAEIDDRRPVIIGYRGQLNIPGLEEEKRTLGEVRLQEARAVLRSLDSKTLVNLKELQPGQTAILNDGDLITIEDIPEISILFLNPHETPTRNLSDLIADRDSITIGTAAENTCRLVHPSLSRKHAVIWREQNALHIRDLGSTNGTTVDGRRIVDSAPLQPGIRLSLGRLPFIADAGCWGPTSRSSTRLDVRFVGISVEIAGKLRLNKVSFGADQGEMVGLLGPSASGKSTLLKLLAGQYRLVEGEMYVNGQAMSQNQSRWNWLTSLMGFRDENYQVGFVQQIDLVSPGLTVRQILEFAARQMGVDSAEASKRAERSGTLCNLGPLMDRVAQTGDGQLNMSGGQLKRICVAIEVLRQPKILVLDEPTTGQDPKNTDDLMHLFRALSQEGVTLLMSTHDLRNISLFDKVAVLCLGYLVYYGPPASFPAQFNAQSPEAVYASLPDRESRLAEAQALALKFQGSVMYERYCRVTA